MLKVPDSTRPNSGGSRTGESTNSGDGSEMFADIKSANRKIRLIEVLRNYGFKIEKNYQRPEWSNNITCPLPSHKGAKERTPSFAYNFVSDHFNCFGCGQSGRGVEFISLYEGLPRTVVAERVLSKYGNDISDDDEIDYSDDISPILFDGSKHLQHLIQKYKNDPIKLKLINKLIWWIDFYFMIAVPKKRVTTEKLQLRIDRIKELV
jgi:hypothetical protein